MSIIKLSTAVMAFLLSALSSHSADIKCLDSMMGTRQVYRPKDQRPYQTVTQCRNAGLFGKIETGDAEIVERFLDEQKYLSLVHLESPGGNVVEAIKIGRMIRRRFLGTAARPYSAGQSSEYKCGTSSRFAV
jgi:hypothetical protein